VTSLTVLGCTDADWPTILQIDEQAFGSTWDEDEGAADRAVLELDRSLLARVDGQPVGHTTAYSLQMSVPGGSDLACAGVTWVGVVPTHRRQGVLTALMDQQLNDIHERGEALAALYASEPVIYGRFGYGAASHRVSLSIERGYSALDGPVDPALRVWLTNLADGRKDIEQVYDESRIHRAGLPSRSDLWWTRCMNDPKSMREGASELRCVLVADERGPRAYAVFSVKHDWSSSSADGEIRIHEHACLDASAAMALWRLILGMDLIGRVSHWNVPTDDVLLQLLVDARRACPILRDSVYVRLVDLPAALAARAYDVAFDGVVEVVDRLAPWNAGRWRLATSTDGAECVRTDADPDLVLDVRELGAAFLGGTSLVAHAAAGRVQERTPGSVAALSRAFRHEPAPYCSFVF
jgi:predicted acetyltransferase